MNPKKPGRGMPETALRLPGGGALNRVPTRSGAVSPVKRMDTLYTLCRSADNRWALPLTAEQAAEVAARKRAYFADEAARNPLVAEILREGTLDYHGLEKDDRRGFLQGPAGFLRCHEVLRRTQRSNRPVRIGGREFAHDEAAGLFARCVPNAKLEHRPWYSTSRYTTTLALAWGVTLLAAHLVGRDEGTGLFEPRILSQLGLLLTAAAVVTSALRSNRDLRHAAPWNSAVYLDLNASLVRRGAPELGLARKETLPRQRTFKTPAFYYPLAERVRRGGYDDELRRLASVSPS
jgi:hypothetical protein